MTCVWSFLIETLTPRQFQELVLLNKLPDKLTVKFLDAFFNPNYRKNGVLFSEIRFSAKSSFENHLTNRNCSDIHIAIKKLPPETVFLLRISKINI